MARTKEMGNNGGVGVDSPRLVCDPDYSQGLPSTKWLIIGIIFFVVLLVVFVVLFAPVVNGPEYSMW